MIRPEPDPAEPDPVDPAPVLRFERVTFRRDGRDLLSGVDWSVRPGEHWVVLGANGSGKTTLTRLSSLYEHATEGVVEVLGGRLGTVDVRSHRTRIGVTSAATAALLRPRITAADAVMTAKHAALEPWWHHYDEADRERALRLLAAHGVADRANDPVGRLSSGERQRVLLARAGWFDPGLLLLDEPTAGLDLGGREQLVAHLGELACREGSAPMVLVTHHVEEIPVGFTHLLALRNGRVLTAGPLAETLDASLLTSVFGVPLQLVRSGAGRYTAIVADPSGAPPAGVSESAC